MLTISDTQLPWVLGVGALTATAVAVILVFLIDDLRARRERRRLARAEIPAAVVFTDAEIAALAGLAAADAEHAAAPDALLVEIYTAQTKYRFKDIYGEDGQT